MEANAMTYSLMLLFSDISHHTIHNLAKNVNGAKLMMHCYKDSIPNYAPVLQTHRQNSKSNHNVLR